MLGFRDGYTQALSNLGGYCGATMGGNYVATVEAEIEKLNVNINSFAGYRTDVSKLKGDIAEFWHSGTHNIDAAVKDVTARTFVDRSKGLGSADITSTWEEQFGLKYYKDASASAQQQAKTYLERYKEYDANSSKDVSFEEWLMQSGITDVDPNSPLYLLQTRIIPTDQLPDAIKWLEQKIATEQSIRPDQVARYKDTLDMLKDKIESSDGSKSIALTKEESELIAKMAKKGDFDSSQFGITTEELIRYKFILNQSLKAGVSAAAITIILKVAPEIYKAIELLITNGEVDREQLSKIGFAAITGGSEGFIRGSVAAGITMACKSGVWGQALKSVDPTMVSVATVIVMNAVANSFKVANGNMSRGDFVNACAKDLFVTACSMTLGGITQGLIEIPILGFLLGSFVGSVVGGMVYNSAQGIMLSFCVESGFTFFGLVEQNYELPNEVLKEIGFEVLGYEKNSYIEFQPKIIHFKTIEYIKPEYHTIDITVLRRGVIGVNRVGYI